MFFLCNRQSLLDIFNNVLDSENLEGWITLQDVSTSHYMYVTKKKIEPTKK